MVHGGSVQQECCIIPGASEHGHRACYEVGSFTILIIMSKPMKNLDRTTNFLKDYELKV